MDSGQCAGVSSQSYIEYSDKMLEKARANTIAAGSPTPWWGKFYDEGDGSHIAIAPDWVEGQ
jgi:preprotein translocase subunit Sec61beta